MNSSEHAIEIKYYAETESVNLLYPSFATTNNGKFHFIINGEKINDHNIKAKRGQIINAKFEISKEILDYDNMFRETPITCLNVNSLWDTSEVISMSSMFRDCYLFESFTTKYDLCTDNVNYMSAMFFGCKSLKILPDISKWRTSNLFSIDEMFYGCRNLTYLPDISEWDTKELEYCQFLFAGCISLSYIPNLEKWNMSNIKNIDGMFSECSSVSIFPNMNIGIPKFEKPYNIFYGCFNLACLPENIKFKSVNNIENCINMINRFK